MSDRMLGYCYIAALLVLSFAFQYHMKVLANTFAPVFAKSEPAIPDKMLSIFRHSLHWRPLLVILIAGLLFAIWLLALTKLELSVALPLASIALIINSVGAGLLLGEQFTLLRALGILTVASGIAMVIRS